MIGEFRLYWRYIRMHLRAGVQYKGWYLMVLTVLITVVTDPLSTILMFSRFGGIGEWSMERILLMYSMAVACYGLAETFWRGFDYFAHVTLRNGDFDRLLLRPRSTYVQVAASYFHIHRIARAFTGLAAVCWCLWRLDAQMTPLRIAMLAGAILGGFIMYCGVFIFVSGLSFYSIKGLDWTYIFTNAGYQVTRIPMPYMPKVLRAAFTFFVPILAISYYPASAMLGWGEPFWRGFIPLPAGIAFLLLSCAVWRIGVAHYNGTGS